MKFTSKCMPMGVMPYMDVQSATRMVAKLYPNMPGLFMLPNISAQDNIIDFTLSNISGIKNSDGLYLIKMASEFFLNSISDIEKTYNTPSAENLSKYASDSVFLDKYLKIIKKFNSGNACFELLGPVSLAYILTNKNKSKEELLIFSQKVYRKFLIEVVCIKALCMIHKIKKMCQATVPIVILNEPYLNMVGEFKRRDESVTTQTFVNILTKVTDKLKSEGAVVVVHSMSKCDWTIPISAGADIISFDAYNNPNNLSIIPEQVTKFIVQGGKINWAIVPTVSENHIKTTSVDGLYKRFTASIENLILAGVPAEFLYASAMISTHNHMEHLPLMFAEKAVMMASHLAKKIPSKL